MIKHLFTFAFIILGSLLAMGQKEQLEWGELEGRSGNLIEIMPLHGKDFYTLRWKGGNAFGGYYLSRFTDLKEVKSKRVSIAVNYNIANFEDVIIVDEHPSVILTNVKDGKEQVYLQQYSYELEPRGEAKLLANYEIQKGMSKEDIKIIQSKDKEYFAVLWLLIGRKKDHDVYGYAIYNKKFKLVDQGEYEIPIESRYSQLTHHLLSNTGDYFFVIKEFEPNQTRGLNQPDLAYKAMHIFQVNEGELKDYTLPFQGKRVEAISVNTNDSSSYIITGVYGANEFNGAQGVFYMKLNFKNQEITQQSFHEFDKDFITEDWTKREKERAERREARGVDEPSLYNYQMREAQLLPDGSMVGIMEQNYVVVSTFSDVRSIMTISYTYYYNDIVLFKINKDGAFGWVTKVKKSQISTNDGGPFSSFASISDSSTIRLIFNDNIENYDEQGKYIPKSENYTRFSKRYNTVALVEVDVKSGEQKRNTLFSRKETKTIAVPKLFKVDMNSKEMLLYTMLNGRELYGILNIGNQ